MTDVSPERTGEPEIATTTLAEIYVQQGLYDRALAIYRRVAERSPEDERVAERLAEIEREIEQVRAGREPAPVQPLEVAGSGGAVAPTPAPPPTVPAVADDDEFLAWLDRR